MTATTHIRNLAITGSTGAGKTSLVERLLFASGTINALGEVQRGTTTSDHDPQSIEAQHSVDVSLVHVNHRDRRFNLLDTPGYPDFVGRTISILPAVETLAMVIAADDGVESLSERLMELACLRDKCRLVIINKIDVANCDLPGLVEQIQGTLGAQCLPINLPASDHQKVEDCYFAPNYDAATEFSTVQACHDALIDQVVEVDEELMELYLEQGQELQPPQLHDPFENALRSQHLVPICFVSARSGAGIDLLLQIIGELMPHPAEGNPPLFLNKDQPVTLTTSAEDHLIAHVFKVSIDPFLGRLALVRVHQGRLTPESQLFIGDSKKTFKPGHLFDIQGKERHNVAQALPGEICAIAKVDELHFDDVLHDSHEEDHFHLKSLEFPPPMYGLAIHPTRRGDEQKLSDTLKKLAAEDPSLCVEHRVNLNETVLQGIGELHLKTALAKMAGQFNLTVDTAVPSIDYRETVTRPAKAHYRHKKQTGGAGQFGEVHLEIEPLAHGEGFEFVSKVVGGAVPGQFIPAVEKGVRQIMSEGAIGGFPMQDIRVTLTDGKHHSVDSKEIAFVTAGRKAFLEAVREAKPVILEPIVAVEVITPSDAMGDITADITVHRGMITETCPMSRSRTMIKAKLPLAEMADYASRLKSKTAGEGSFTLALSHFDQVSGKVQADLSKNFKVSENA